MEYATREHLPEKTRKMMVKISQAPKKEVKEKLKGNFIEKEGAVKSPKLTEEDLEEFLFEKREGKVSLAVEEPTVLIAAMQNPNLSKEKIGLIASEASHPIVQLYALNKLDDDDHAKVNLLSSRPYLSVWREQIAASPETTWF